MGETIVTPRSLKTTSCRGGDLGKVVGPRGQVTVPISQTSTYQFASTAEIVDYFEHRLERFEYGRYGNPTIAAAESTVAALDGAEACALFASGMAAITTTLLAMARAGTHIIMTADCYRRTRQFGRTWLARFGVEVTLVPAGDPQAIASAIRPGKTRAILAESPTNPYLRVADVVALAGLCSEHRIKLIVDSTFATPINQRPLKLGADLVIHSATKYLGGHNDLLAGTVSGSADLIGAITDARGVLGSVSDPNSAYLLVRGLKTLAIRVEQQNRSALEIATFLEAHPAVAQVHYPGLASHPDHVLARSQMSGFGGVVSFTVGDTLDDASRFIDACELPMIAPSLGGVETLIEQPAYMSYFELSSEERAAIGIEDNLIRLAIGIEGAADIWADLEQALGLVGTSMAHRLRYPRRDDDQAES